MWNGSRATSKPTNRTRCAAWARTASFRSASSTRSSVADPPDRLTSGPPERSGGRSALGWRSDESGIVCLMTQRPAVLIMQRHLAPLSAFLEGAYDVYRFWEGPPIEAAGDIRALIVAGESELDKALIERLPNLSLVACFTAGYDGIDVEWCRARGLPVTHAPGVNHEDVADHAIGLILAARRQIAEGDRTIRAGEWKLSTRSITTSLGGQRLGIVGLGHIGEAVARRAEVMRMDIRWWAPREKETAWSRADSLIDLARGSDVLVVACRADES